jgi:HEAT repeat protein
MTVKHAGLALIVVSGVIATAASLTAQQPASSKPATLTPGAIGVDEATTIAQGWALLAQGLVDEAATRAAKAMAASPRSPAALVLMVEVDIARRGAQAGLSRYEVWLGQRTLEEPAVLRRIATALLREAAAQSESSTARLEALQALAADGDPASAAALAGAVKTAGMAERRVLASMGNEAAVGALIADLKSGNGNAMTIIEALAKSGSKSAIAPLTDRLQHASPEIRGAAVEGLGKLGAALGSSDLIVRIKPLLSDPTSYVRVKAAGALYGLNDTSGLQVLQELIQAEPAASRLIALQAMASRPDASWLDDVKRLTSVPEPEIRVGAARLLAPHDPELARKVLEGATQDPNPAIRELAAETVGAVEASDFPTLRQLMKSNNRVIGVRASARVLELTLR